MDRKFLIAFYSRTGNTERIARMIHQQIGGTLHRIIPASPYPKAYHETVDQAKQEIKSRFHPPLRDSLTSIGAYDPILIGSPNWWSTIAPPVATFLSQHDLSGKTIAPFCTHGGGGLGHMTEDITGFCPKAILLKPLLVYGQGRTSIEAQVVVWLEEISQEV